MLSCFSFVWLFATQWTIAPQDPLSRDSPGKNTGVSSHFLLQGIFLTQRWNPHFMSLVLADEFFTSNTIWETIYTYTEIIYNLYVQVGMHIYTNMYLASQYYIHSDWDSFNLFNNMNSCFNLLLHFAGEDMMIMVKLLTC